MVKPVSEFYQKQDGRYGVGTICKTCTMEKGKEYRRKRRDKEVAQRETAEFKTLMGEAKVKMAKRCELCEKLRLCQERVRQGLWVLCETPDEADIYRAEEIFKRAKRTQTDGEAVGEGRSAYAD